MTRISIHVDGAERVASQFDAMAIEIESEVVYAVGTPLEYSIWQEIGTTFHPPQPYMRPSVEEVRAKQMKYLASNAGFDEAIEDMAKDVRDKAKDRAPVDTGALKRSIEMERLK